MTGFEQICPPIVFVHLSDLHFREPGTPLAEREAMLRNQLLDDVPATVGLAAGDLQAVLLTGDLSRAGQALEYRSARQWLDQLCERLSIPPTSTLTCPGNHDVDWGRLDAGRAAINEVLRTCDPSSVDARIDDLLEKEPETVLAPLENYQEFAAAYACDLSTCLAWDLPPISLGSGYSLAIRGANTVINSDWDDSEGTMAVQSNQLLVDRQPGVVRMLLLHHGPKFWKRPNPNPVQYGHHVVLYGHTHKPDHTLSETCLEVTAGAVHPEEHEVFAKPGYNVIELSIEHSSDQPDVAFVRTRVFHRDFSRTDNDFLPIGDAPTVDERVQIPKAGIAHATGDPSVPDHGGRSALDPAGLGVERASSSGAEMQPPLETSAGQPDPSRVARAAYEGLGAGDRRRVLTRISLPPDQFRSLHPHAQIREVTRLVVESGKVAELLEAVAAVSE